MRSRYRIYVCPEPSCAVIGKNAESICPIHEQATVAIIVRREDSTDQAIRTEHTAKRVAEAGAKVGEAAGKPADSFGIAEMFRGMADDIAMGRPSRYSDVDADADLEDEDDEEEDEDR